MYTAIVRVENNRIAKFAEYGTEQEAQSHVDKYGGFVYAGSYHPDLYVDGEVTTKPQSVSMVDYDIAIERMLDAEALEAGYYDPLGRIPSIDRACSYAGFENQYQAEAQSFVVWRSAVWAYAYNVKSEVEAGNRTQPTIAELIAELPQRT